MPEQVPAPAAPAPATVFNGRSFVPASVVPSGESPSSSEGNDEAGDASADADVLSTTTNESGGAADGDGSGGESAGDAARPRGTFWDQTPEEKREERFNNAIERGNQLAAKVKEYEAKQAKYEAGEGPKPTAAETPASVKTSTAIFNEALTAKDEAILSEAQRQIRQINVETVDLFERTVKPAQAAVQTAQKALSDVTDSLQSEKAYLAGLRKRAEGRDGLYDTEIQEAEESIRRLEYAAHGAKSDLVNARLDAKEAKEAWEDTKAANRGKAVKIAEREGQKHHETASQADAQKRYAAEEEKLDSAWTKAVDTVLGKLKIPKEDREDAADLAYAKVKAIADKRGDTNPVTDAEFEALILQSLKRYSTRIGSVVGDEEAEIADARARATDQPTPKKRVASGQGDAKPKSKDEAFENLRRVMNSSRMKVAS